MVEIKKTQRPEDYPIISRLALAFLSEKPNPTPEDCLWAIDNVFTVGELRRLMLRYGAELADLMLSPLLARALDANQSESDWPPELEDEIDAWQQQRASRIRQADRRYWRTVIEELRELRNNGSLMVEGTLV